MNWVLSTIKLKQLHSPRLVTRGICDQHLILLSIGMCVACMAAIYSTYGHAKEISCDIYYLSDYAFV